MPFLDGQCWQELIRLSGYPGGDDIRMISDLETVNEDKDVPEHRLRVEMTSGHQAHWLGGWLLRHLVMVGNGPDASRFVITCSRSEKGAQPPGED